MSDLTYINKDLVMEGTLQAKDSQVVIAGKYKGSIEAKTVILEASSRFDGTLHAEHLKIEGQATGDITAEFLEITGSGNFDGKLKTNSLSVDMGAKVSGNVGRITG
jgi:cytoskeletal protein CcmA (bactofilin family)